MFKDDIDRIVKSIDEKKLNAIEEQVKRNLESGDKNFWTEVQDNISVFKAKTGIKKYFDNYMAKNIEVVMKVVNRDLLETIEIENDIYDPTQSPILYADETEFEGLRILGPEEERKIYTEQRSETLRKELEDLIISQQKLVNKPNPLLTSDSALYNVLRNEKVVGGDLENSVDDLMKIDMMKLYKPEDGEIEFGELVSLKPILEDWSDKYRPRKPKYFNRVKTGYEWTKHNQTHFDHRNPPPKVVQGYKFNIFYPCLIDKTKAPQFYLEPDETTDTCIIRFHAGPPYEDIAFRIINREWDFSDRHGFKSFFDKGILHLYFNFKRHRYKR